MAPRTTQPKTRKPTKKTVRNRAWRICSEYIRRKHADADGMVQCTTCSSKKHWREMHAGHFIPKTFDAVYFIEENIWPQCPKCNTWRHGALMEYTLHIIDTYGRETVEWLQGKARDSRPLTVDELLEIEKEFKESLHDLGTRGL